MLIIFNKEIHSNMDPRYSTPSAGGFNPRYVSDFYSPSLQGRRGGGMGFLYMFLILLVLAIVLSLVIWLMWYRPTGITLGQFFVLVIRSIIEILLWPFKFILQVLGIWTVEVVEIIEDEVDVLPEIIGPPKPTTHTEVIKHEVSECPPCTNECNCPTCEETDIRPYELEIKYLKNMVKMTGSIARRENAINSQYRELYPGFSVMSPHVRKISHEYNFIKNEIRKDPEQWGYFKNYYSRISGIPSSSQAVHYDLVL